MYTYTNSALVSDARKKASKLLSELTTILKSKYALSATCSIVGSAKHNLVTCDDNTGLFDLDYNMCITKMGSEFKTDLRRIKDIVRTEMDKISKGYGYQPGQDSTSVITLKNNGYSMDLGILIQNSENDYCRLIHNKSTGSYVLNEISHSFNLNSKVKYIAQHGQYQYLRDLYLKEKNKNPQAASFEVYVQVVNRVFNEKGGQKMSKVSGNTHSQSQMNHHANQSNPNNAAHTAANNNHSNQCNPNHTAGKNGKSK